MVYTPSSLRLFVQLATDQHAPDLARAGADLIKLGVAQQPPGRIIINVSIATEALDRLERHPGRALAGIQDRTRSVLARGLALIARAGDRIDVGLRRVHGDVHVRELRLDKLKGSDRLPELSALVHIGHH